jgi:Fervidolysin N-terminal prodomain
MIGASAHGSVGEACSYALRPLVHYLAFLLLCCHEIAFAAPDTHSAVADELLVAPRLGVERTPAERICHSHRAAITDEIPQIGVHVLRVTAESLASVERALSHREEFEFVEQNSILSPALTANDTYYPQERHLQPEPQIAAQLSRGKFPSSWVEVCPPLDRKT